MNKFINFGLEKNLITRLNKNGINIPTEIQDASIQSILDGKDIIGEAPTGTGKTLAYLLPILNKIKKSDKVQGLIVAPTRELVLQIADEAQKYNHNNINILTVYGGKNYSSQLKGIECPDLIVATPGRLIDLMSHKIIDISKIKILVLDEADQMLLMGFQNDIENIVKVSPKKRQTLCFSATLSKEIKKLAYRICINPILINIDNNIDNNKMKKFLVESGEREKIDALCTVMNETNPFMAIIFCRTKFRVDKLEEKLAMRGYNVQKLHSDIVQTKREKILKSFRDAEIQYLIATDVASRGLDIQGVTHIYSYDMPEKAETYVHRVGRSARGLEKGKTYLFSTPKDKEIVVEIENLLGMTLERLSIEIQKDVVNTNETFVGKYNKKIKARTKEKRISKK
jgi:superfamily II DNA/RNA helicase